MTERLWAPWRLAYIESADGATECVFCVAATSATPADSPDSLVIERTETAVVMLNKYPYAPGHLLVAPSRHCGAFGELDAAEAAEIHGLAARGIEALTEASAPHGFNVGWNLGRAAGAGIVDHVHMHVVPRWGGDTNFMPILADVRVMPEHLADTRAKLLEVWAG